MMTAPQIQACLAGLAPVADHFPGVVSVHNLRTLGIEYMSPLGLQTLGTTLPALRALGPGYPRQYLPTADAAAYEGQLRGLLARNDESEIRPFFQQVRTVSPPGWAWYLGTMRLLLRDAGGQPLLALIFACPLALLSPLTPKVGRLLAEQDFLRAHQPLFAQLTRRERQVLRLLAQGKNSAAIAGELFISAHTVIAHRRNINAKLRPQTPRDLARYADAFDLV